VTEQNKNPEQLGPQSLETYYSGEIDIVNPAELTELKPILYVPGFSMDLDVTSESRHMLADESGQSVISYSPEPGSFNSKTEEGKKWSKAQLHNAAELISVIEKTKTDGPVDVVAHSQGALATVIAADMLPEGTIDKLVLVAPAGFIEKETKKNFVSRFIGKMKLDSEMIKSGNSTIKKLKRNGYKYSFKHPIGALREGFSVTSDHVTAEVLSRLEEKGIKISVISSDNDVLFPFDLQKEAFESSLQDINIGVSTPVGYEEVDGELRTTNRSVHDAILYDKRTIKAVVAILDSLK